MSLTQITLMESIFERKRLHVVSTFSITFSLTTGNISRYGIFVTDYLKQGTVFDGGSPALRPQYVNFVPNSFGSII